MSTITRCDICRVRVAPPPASFGWYWRTIKLTYYSDGDNEYEWDLCGKCTEKLAGHLNALKAAHILEQEGGSNHDT